MTYMWKSGQTTSWVKSAFAAPASAQDPASSLPFSAGAEPLTLGPATQRRISQSGVPTNLPAAQTLVQQLQGSAPPTLGLEVSPYGATWARSQQGFWREGTEDRLCDRATSCSLVSCLASSAVRLSRRRRTNDTFCRWSQLRTRQAPVGSWNSRSTAAARRT